VIIELCDGQISITEKYQSRLQVILRNGIKSTKLSDNHLNRVLIWKRF